MRWRKPRPIQVVALVISVLAAGSVLVVFNRMSGFMGRTKVEPQLVANIDLSIGNTVLAGQRGEAQARLDIEAGLLQLQAFGPAPGGADVARIQQIKHRFGLTWVRKGESAGPVAQAFADGYNRVMQAEAERRHGGESLDRRLRELNLGPLAVEDRRYTR
jgi:hypothetical protein